MALNRMKQKIKYLEGFFFSVIFLVFTTPAFAAEEKFPLVQMSCKPELSEQSAEKTSLSMPTGEEVIFQCLIQNINTSVASRAFLLGQRKTERSGTTVSMSEVLLSDTTSIEVTLHFPKMLHSDTYWYSFILMDKVTRLPLSEEQQFTWKFRMDQPAFASVGVEPKQEWYDWGAEAELRVEFTPSWDRLSGDATPNLRVEMKDEKGEICAILLETPIQQSPVYRIRFPEKGACTGVLMATLRSKDSIVLDQKMLALRFSDVSRGVINNSEQWPIEHLSNYLKWGIILISIVSAALIGMVWVRRRK